jgi:GDPmannose 4,6-dehydratase
LKKTALITGISGQDGSYLCELLLEKGYHIHGIIRRSSQFNRSRIENTISEAKRRGLTFELHYGELNDDSSLYKTILRCKPDEIYNLASQSHVMISFEQPEYSTEVNANGVLKLLEAVRNFGGENCRFYQASTSELFGQPNDAPQTEGTPFHPRSPYGVAKLYAYWIVRNYREHYKMHACNGILYNHESPRRGENFVTRKITYSLARILRNELPFLEVGNLDARRDWGYARDYVEAMWLMMQKKIADDYIIASGETHSVREFVEISTKVAGFDLEWEGEGLNEIGVDRRTGNTIVKINPMYYRPNESVLLVGDAAKARKELDWKPSMSFSALVELMMKAELSNSF